MHAIREFIEYKKSAKACSARHMINDFLESRSFLILFSFSAVYRSACFQIKCKYWKLWECIFQGRKVATSSSTTYPRSLRTRTWHLRSCHSGQLYQPRCSSTNRPTCRNVSGSYRSTMLIRLNRRSQLWTDFKSVPNGSKSNWNGPKRPPSRINQRFSRCFNWPRQTDRFWINNREPAKQLLAPELTFVLNQFKYRVQVNDNRSRSEIQTYLLPVRKRKASTSQKKIDKTKN